MNEVKIYLVREGVLRSMFADAFSITVTFCFAFLNHKYFNGMWYFDFLAIALFFVSLRGFLGWNSKRFNSEIELRDYLDSKHKQCQNPNQ